MADQEGDGTRPVTRGDAGASTQSASGDARCTRRPRRTGRPEGDQTRLDHELAWTLTNLKREGLVTNPARSIWELTDAARQTPPTLAAPVVLGRVNELRAMPYRQYLLTPEWRATRGAALVRFGHACSLDANHTDRLEVHHRTYDRLGEERADDVIVLCHACHRRHHDHVGRPRRRAQKSASIGPPTFQAGVGSDEAAGSRRFESRQSLVARLFSWRSGRDESRNF